VVERKPEELGVVGSIPTLGTTFLRIFIVHSFHILYAADGMDDSFMKEGVSS
jgi:hypothetical protein